ncbi:kdo(2)-lipid A phosphoethanolamine 7''-transferase [Chitinimonas sp. BJB300]|uniref:kdo(2)-lipid A phosphoethanolamine 7''-transferase n=1 Tax=Chitinimonas sp. BJB300 TaxID=1559339 RepID=UPI000C10DE5A|nr:kdo(2)-lipid A phosphoethanolamine 7''-transferase [Chitinimonas sp. BJB300]PHV12454.1 kdo(2)-lipid A phosphoethanolamine 7''-transferase [Chitinimonas sp. BJB300]TSJ88578.1 kdo(2)-lipid A phosphoethanolamine 7''-transferase [Chitinimonas sp. BJB300]
MGKKILLITLCCIYISIFLNIPVFWKRTDLILLFSSCLFLFSFSYLPLYCASFFGVNSLKITASAILIASSVASYFMYFYNAVIDYGVIQAVFTTEKSITLEEVVDLKFILWNAIFGVLPIGFLWWYKIEVSPKRPWFKSPGVWVSILSGPACMLFIFYFLSSSFDLFEKYEEESNFKMAQPAVVIAQTHIPTNWMLATSVYAYDFWRRRQEKEIHFDPSKHFNYVLPKYNDDTFVVVVIGETTRYDHMGIFGYARNTTPLLAQEKNMVPLRGHSCDTITRSSLSCMFVRPGGTIDSSIQSRPILKEENVFKVFKSLGFSMDLFSTQGEIKFYLRTGTDSFKFSESYAAEANNLRLPIYDTVMLPDFAHSLENHPNGKHVVILHTMGSHYKYSVRYTKSFDVFGRDSQVKDSNSNNELINTYDNSILSTDSFLSHIFEKLRNKKAVLIYTSDHGESLGENGIFRHGAPKSTAPIEQRNVPFIIWASDLWLAEAKNRDAFERIRQKQDTTIKHETLFSSMLDCLGITSNNGGIDKKYSWCSE